MKSKEINGWYFIVKMLPKKLIYFCFMHVMIHSTTGKYSATITPSLSGMDAIKRYSDDFLNIK